MRNFSNSIVSIFSRLLATFGLIGAVTLLIQPFRPYLTLQIIVLIYLLPIMLSTVLWGLTPGIVSSLLAFLTFNYFFIEPLHTLRVHSTLDLITLIIFLIIAIVMSQLIGRAREGSRIAKMREWEATRMYELTSRLAGEQEVQEIAKILASQTSITFESPRVEVCITGRENESDQVIEYPENAPQSGGSTMRIPFKALRGVEGEMKLWRQKGELSPAETRLIETFSSQAALALERVRLTKGENKARVLEESDRLKTSILNSVSHELRSPLSAIKASVSSLRSGTVAWESAARQELLETIEEETDQLNLLVGNLLDMSRIEAGALSPNLRWNSIGEIARGVVKKMSKQLQGFSVKLQLSEALPLVPTDYVMMEQVFSNLLSNSTKYAPPGSTIEILGKQEGECIQILMTNEGPPVPEEHLDRIFDKFNRVTSADRITGTGLGLSICKGIVEAHHGKIWAENRLNRLVFLFTLPTMKDGIYPEFPKEASNG